MKSASPRNALAFLGDKLQARRDAAFLEEYRKQEHASLRQEGFYSTEGDAEILAKQQKVTSVIKYNNQNPGERTSFSTSAQLLYYSPVNPSAEHGRSSNSPRRRQMDTLSQGDMANADATLSPKTLRRSRFGATATVDRSVDPGNTHSFNATTGNAERAVERALSLSATQRFHAAVEPATDTDNAIHQTAADSQEDSTGTKLPRSTSMTGHTQRGKRLSELLQATMPVNTRRHGAATVRFSDATSTEHTNSGKSKPVQQPGESSKHHAASGSWHGSFLTSPGSGTGLIADITQQTDPTDESVAAELYKPADVSRGSSLSSGSCSGSDTDSGSDSEANSETEPDSHATPRDVISTSGGVTFKVGTVLPAASSMPTDSTADAALQLDVLNESGPVATQSQRETQQPLESLADRCLMPLSRLQRSDFLPAGTKRTSDSRHPSQMTNQFPAASSTSSSIGHPRTSLVWQGSGWAVPFNAALVERPGQKKSPVTSQNRSRVLSTSSSWHTTSLDAADSTALPAMAVGTVCSTGSANAVQTAVSAEVGPSNSAAPLAAQTPQSDLHTLPISQASPEQQLSAIAAKHAKHGGLGQTGTRHRKHSRQHGEAAGMAHVEDHLQILKHVHLKKASPRTLLQNRSRAEQLGFAALPETLEGWQPAAPPTSLRPVTGQDTWYRVGMHVMPEELNAAVLEALAAEAAGLPAPMAQTGPPQPNTSPSASWLMRMEASVKVIVYDEKLDGPAAGKQTIPAINPNRAYLKSLAQGSAKKHFQSVEVDLRESHRRLLATQAALQPVTYGSRIGSISA